MRSPWKVFVLTAVTAGVIWVEGACAALPSWEKWSGVQVGQSRGEVEAILGAPESVESVMNTQLLCYGIITPKSEVFPRPIGFFVHLAGDKVVAKEQPFEDGYSLEGVPTTPRLASPADKQVFFHHPRYLDLRWWPSSGAQPVKYELRLEATTGRLKDGADIRWFQVGSPPLLTVPHHAISFIGTQPGRWSVRAVNDAGKSEWSEWQTFDWEYRK